MMSSFVLGAVISCLFIAVYWVLFTAMHRRPRLKSLLLGTLPVSFAAVLIESMIIPVFSAFVFLVVLAPVVEELLKFAGTTYKRDLSAGLGIGLGFALSENALYFGSFTSAGALVPLSFLVSFILLRGLADPVLHSFTAALSTGTWRTRKPRWLGYSILIHASYNFTAFVGLSSLAFIAPADALITVLLLSAFVLWLRRSPSHISVTFRQLATGAGSPVPAAYPGAPWSRLAMRQIRWRKRDETVAQAEPAALSPPPGLSQEELLKWVTDNAKQHGFNTVAASLGLKNEYERTSWMRHSVFTQEGRQSHSYELGRSGITVMATLIAGAALLFWLVFL